MEMRLDTSSRMSRGKVQSVLLSWTVTRDAHAVLHNARLIIHGSETRMEIKPEEIFPIWKLPRMLAAEYTPFYIKLSSDLAY